MRARTGLAAGAALLLAAAVCAAGEAPQGRALADQTSHVYGVPGEQTGTDAHSDEHTEHTEHEGHASHQHDVIFFLFNGIMLGTAVVHVTTYVHRLSWVQPTVATFALGMVYSLVIELSDTQETSGIIGKSYGMWMQIDPHLLLFTLLPLLLTGDAMSIDTSVARIVGKQCLYLAGPGVMMNTILMALFLWKYLPYDWPFLLCFTIGSILAATDPVAVVSLLKELGASPVLTVQIQGESLLNDGMAIVLFTVAYDMLKGTVYEAKDIVMVMLKTALGAWLLGALIGAAFVMWIRLAGNRLEHSSTMIQISLTLCCAYSSFFIAEGILGISGVLSTVAASLVLADNIWTTIVNKEAMHEVWHIFEYFGNTLIFFLAGALTAKSMVNIPLQDYFYLFYIYVVMVLVRGFMIIMSRPMLQVLSPDRTPVSLANCIVMTWGGLRGALGLALAVQVNMEKAGGLVSALDADRLLFYAGGIACLTLLINATTCPSVVNWLGLTSTSETKKHILRNIYQQLAMIVEQKDHSLGVASILDDMLKGVEHEVCPEGLAAWQEAELSSKRHSEKEQQKPARKSLMASARGVIVDDEVAQFLSGMELVERLDKSKELLGRVKGELDFFGDFPKMPFLDEEARFVKVVLDSEPDPKLLTALHEAFLTLVRAQYWHMIEAGFYVPGTRTAGLSLKSTSHALQHVDHGLQDLEFLEEQLGVKALLPKPKGPPKKEGLLVSWLLKMMEPNEPPRQEVQDDSPNDRVVRRHSLVKDTPSQAHLEPEVVRPPGRVEKIVHSFYFTIFIFATIAVNMVLIVAENTEPEDTGVVGGYLAADVIFSVIYLVEFFLKYYLYRNKYFFDGWNLFDFSCLILTLMGLGIKVVIMTGSENGGSVPAEAELLRANRILRVFRAFRAAAMFRTFRLVLAKYKDRKAQLSNSLAKQMEVMQTMISFARAHIASQYEFLKYFGENQSLYSIEEVHCILESRAAVYVALTRAAHEASKVDESFMMQLRVLTDSTKITSEMSHYMHHALETGIISSREAETVTDCLKKHEGQGHLIMSDAHMGLKSTFMKDIGGGETLGGEERSPFGNFEKLVAPHVPQAYELEGMMQDLMCNLHEYELSPAELETAAVRAEHLLKLLSGGKGAATNGLIHRAFSKQRSGSKALHALSPRNGVTNGHHSGNGVTNGHHRSATNGVDRSHELVDDVYTDPIAI